MSGATCEQIRRRASAAGADLPADVEEHLAACDECRTFVEGLDAVLHHAPSLVPPVPAALRGEVLEGLGAPASATSGPGARRWGRLAGVSRRTVLSLLGALGGAVLGLVVVFLLAGPGPTGDDAAARLATVAQLHAGQGTSHRFDVAGDVELRLPPGPTTPGRTELAARLARLGPVEELDTGAVVEVSFRGQGETDGRGALAYELRWRLAGPVAAGGVLDVVSVDGRSYLRRDGAPWTATEGRAGFDLGVVELPHHLGEVLGALEQPEEAATMARVELRGEAVDHLRARTATGMVVDAWVGADDDWLRRLRWIPAPPAEDRDGTTHGEVVVRFHEHGRARVLGVPDDAVDLGELDADQRPPLLPDAAP